jgi:hypothetical protein
MTKISTRKTQELREGIYPSTKPTRSASQKIPQEKPQESEEELHPSINPQNCKCTIPKFPQQENKRIKGMIQPHQKKTESTLQKIQKKNNTQIKHTWTHCELGFGERRV